MERTVKFLSSRVARIFCRGRKVEAGGRSLPSPAEMSLRTSKEKVLLHHLAVQFSTGIPVHFSPGIYTHTLGALYERYEPAEAKRILDRFEFVYTPKHGSWLNMAEIELNVLNNQCLGCRIGTIEEARKKVEAWEKARNGFTKKINWQFTKEKARIKLKRLYPSYDR